MLEFGNVRLALVTPGQHPPHLGFLTDQAAEFGVLQRHRDGTWSTYVQDPSGNVIELQAPFDTSRV